MLVAIKKALKKTSKISIIIWERKIELHLQVFWLFCWRAALLEKPPILLLDESRCITKLESSMLFERSCTLTIPLMSFIISPLIINSSSLGNIIFIGSLARVETDCRLRIEDVLGCWAELCLLKDRYYYWLLNSFPWRLGAYATSSIMPWAIPPNLGIKELARVDMGIFFMMASLSSKKDPFLLNF